MRMKKRILFHGDAKTDRKRILCKFAFSRQNSNSVPTYRTRTYRQLGIARIFDWGEPKPQIICNDAIKIFRKRNFL